VKKKFCDVKLAYVLAWRNNVGNISNLGLILCVIVVVHLIYLEGHEHLLARLPPRRRKYPSRAQNEWSHHAYRHRMPVIIKPMCMHLSRCHIQALLCASYRDGDASRKRNTRRLHTIAIQSRKPRLITTPFVFAELVGISAPV